MNLLNSKSAPEAKGPYSHAVSTRDFVFCSGQIALDPETGKLSSNDIEIQTRRTFKNIEHVLKEAGLSLKNIVKTTVFLKDINDFNKMNTIYEECFEGHKPARSTIEVSNLPLGASVEIECIAEK